MKQIFSRKYNYNILSNWYIEIEYYGFFKKIVFLSIENGKNTLRIILRNLSIKK